MKALTVIGTWPEAIKMPPVVKELGKYPDEIRSVICATAQHREMLDGVMNIFDIEPGYDLDVMLPNQMLSQCTANIMTDSGGLQEEATSLGVPVQVLREVTERPEGVAAGGGKLVDTDEVAIVREVVNLLEDDLVYQQMSQGVNPYGDGRASQRIVDMIRAMSSGKTGFYAWAGSSQGECL
jgi:UDP-N-acetylglucosamine 2-epimerase